MSFHTFLAEYQEACSRFDADAIDLSVAEDYAGEYRYPGGNVRVYDRAMLMDGWRSAREYFGPAGVCLRYSNIAAAQREEERIVTSWVAMPVRGQETGVSLLVSTFRHTPEGWKLVHEFMQHRLTKDATSDEGIPGKT